MKTKDIRKQMGMTQEAFAKSLDVSVQTVRRWEKSNNPTQPSRLAQNMIRQLQEIHNNAEAMQRFILKEGYGR